MTVFQVKDLHLSFQGARVFEDICVTLGAGQRVGIVGPNGSGKTSLIRAILGEVAPDRGSVDWALKPRIGYVPQKWVLDEAKTPLQLAGYEKSAFLGQCGIGRHLWDSPCSTLSGGERTRLLIALALSGDPGLLVLDEPTNHLDIPGIEWLEKTIRRFPGAALVVSHDRFFLDAVVDRIWEVRDGRLKTYQGGYSSYARAAREERARQSKEHANWEREVADLKQEIVDRRQWFEKAHRDAGNNDFLRRKAKKHARQFLAKETALARLMDAEPEVDREQRDLKVAVGHAGHRTKTVLRAVDLLFSYAAPREAAREIPRARPVLDGVTLSLGPKDKAGLIGSNGSGKTTLIRVLLGELRPQAGEVWLNPGVRMGYLSQMLQDLNVGQSPADNVSAKTGLTVAESRDLLGRMDISGDTQVRPLGTLSMGERTRVAISCLCFGAYDVLVLDEPTNHLDVTATGCVEEALASFPGALVVATHDRYFLDAVCDTIWSLEDGRVKASRGNYSVFRQEREAAERKDAGPHDAALEELSVRAELAYLVSRITAAKDESEKAALERDYSAAVGRLKASREGNHRA